MSCTPRVTVYDLFSERPEDEPVVEEWTDPQTRRVPLVLEDHVYRHSLRRELIYRGSMAVREGREEPLVYRHGLTESRWDYGTHSWRPTNG